MHESRAPLTKHQGGRVIFVGRHDRKPKIRLLGRDPNPVYEAGVAANIGVTIANLKQIVAIGRYGKADGRIVAAAVKLEPANIGAGVVVLADVLGVDRRLGLVGSRRENLAEQDRQIRWESGAFRKSDLLRRKDGLWLCNPTINALFSVRAAAKVFETPWREYLRGPNPIATASHAVFLLASTAPVARALMASHHVRIEPDLDGAEEVLILGGNSRMKLVDHGRGRVTTILKEGFDETLIRRELLFRESGRVAMAPPLLEVSDDRQAFVEPLLHGTVADRLLSRSRAGAALLESLDACDRLAEGMRKTVPLAEWCRAALGAAGAAAERVRDDGSGVVRRAVDWLEWMCLWLTSEGREGGRELETAVSHGDLQPGNVLVEKERVWLIDWERVDERVPWYDAMTLALDARRGYAGLVDRALELAAGRRSDEIGRKAREVLVRRGAEHDHVGRIVMYLVEEIRFCLEESAMGPLVGPAGSLGALVRELDQAGHRLVAEAPSRDAAAVME